MLLQCNGIHYLINFNELINFIELINYQYRNIKIYDT